MLNKDYILEIDKHLSILSSEIGARPTGSQSNEKAENYISKILNSNGFEIELQKFKCIDWRQEEISLVKNEKNIIAEIAYYSNPCDLNCTYISVENLEQLKKVVLKNQILIIHGSLAKETLMPKNFRFWNPEEHKTIIKLLEEINPAAILTESTTDISLTPIIEDGDFNIPCAVISKSDINFLINNNFNTLSLKIKSKRIPTISANVIARTNTNYDKKIVICAHFDTKPNTPGTLDNATGISLLLLLSKILDIKKTNYEIEIIAFNGEDYYSTPGQVIYMDTKLKNPDIYHLAINCDGIGLKNSIDTVSDYNFDSNSKNILEKIIRNNSKIEAIEQWPQGDHMLFAMNNIKTLALTSKDIFNLIDNVIHTKADTLDLVDSTTVYNTTLFLKNLIENI